MSVIPSINYLYKGLYSKSKDLPVQGTKITHIQNQQHSRKAFSSMGSPKELVISIMGLVEIPAIPFRIDDLWTCFNLNSMVSPEFWQAQGWVFVYTSGFHSKGDCQTFMN